MYRKLAFVIWLAMVRGGTISFGILCGVGMVELLISMMGKVFFPFRDFKP